MCGPTVDLAGQQLVGRVVRQAVNQQSIVVHIQCDGAGRNSDRIPQNSLTHGSFRCGFEFNDCWADWQLWMQDDACNLEAGFDNFDQQPTPISRQPGYNVKPCFLIEEA